MSDSPENSGVPGPPQPLGADGATPANEPDQQTPNETTEGAAAAAPPPPPPATQAAPPPPPADAGPPPPPPVAPAGATPPPPGPPPGGGAGARSDNTLMLVLAYLGPLALIPFLVETEDKEVQWHAKNGLLLFAASIVIGLFIGVLSMIPFVGCITFLLYIPYVLGWMVLTILCIVKATKGERYLIPGLSQYADQF
ncbi:MAG: DUF4870 domain-containing protein [Acidobacteriota bacterium]